jgi:hypothetical protein
MKKSQARMPRNKERKRADEYEQGKKVRGKESKRESEEDVPAARGEPPRLVAAGDFAVFTGDSTLSLLVPLNFDGERDCDFDFDSTFA